MSDVVDIIRRDAYIRALVDLNNAAYAALRAGRDTMALPEIDRESMRLICAETDRLLEQGEKSGAFPSLIQRAD